MEANERRRRASTDAADWFARLQAGDMERSERQQFVEWLRESHIHVTEMLRIAQIHGELEQFEHWGRLSTGPKTADDNVVQLPYTPEAHPLQVTGEGRDPRRGKGEVLQGRRLTFFAIAATVLLIVVTALVLPRVRGQVIETERGERREVVLSDGSVLQVDPETRLRVKYAEDVRRVVLERGRALFHVAKNTNRPFLVQADDSTVRAVGTAFGVEQQTQGVVVTVAEGKVAVSSSGFQPPPPSDIATSHPTSSMPPSLSNVEGHQVSSHSITLQQLEREGPSKREGEVPFPSPTIGEGRVPHSGTGEVTLFLTADQQVTVPSSGAAESVREVDSHRALAWAEGRLIFQNDELGKAIAEFNRYNRVQLTVADSGLAAKPVSGVFNASDPEAFIAFLRSVTAVEIVRDGNTSITIGMARRP